MTASGDLDAKKRYGGWVLVAGARPGSRSGVSPRSARLGLMS